MEIALDFGYKFGLRMRPSMEIEQMAIEDYDISTTVGPIFPHYQSAERPPEWPMYSFDAPARILWNAIGKRLTERGWTEAQVKDYLQSKQTRWALDSALGEAIEALGKLHADAVAASGAAPKPR